MLCYRFMHKNLSSYLKFYDAEVIPILLPKQQQPHHIRLSSSAVTRSERPKEENVYNQRWSRMLFRDFHLTSSKWQEQPAKGKTTAVEEAKNSSETKAELPEEAIKLEDDKKLGLVARFKKMYKEYWYVLLPVHIVTSAGWLGGFYYLSVSGVDIASIMENWHFNSTIVAHLRDSKLGHVAIAYFLYKIFTPLRYMVTLGGTTVSIKHLSRLGYIRPVPSKDKLMKMYQDKKAAKQHATTAEKDIK